MQWKSAGRGLVFCLILLWLAIPDRPAQGQNLAGDWTPPTRFFQVEEGGRLRSPSLQRDSGGGLHMFWPATPTADALAGLYYSRWDGAQWSAPIDILVPPDGKDIWFYTARSDSFDQLHVFWLGSAFIWHSSAPAAQAGNTQHWSQPGAIATQMAPDFGLTVVEASPGVWYLAYTNRTLDILSFMRSDDHLATWSSETVIQLESRPDRAIMSPALTVLPDGTVWATWIEWNRVTTAGLGNEAVYLARSYDRGNSWTPPELIIEGYYTASHRVVDGRLVRIVSGGLGVGGRYISFSEDNGLTWSEPVNISSGRGDGMQGVGLAQDSGGGWHFLQQTGDSFATVQWDGAQWQPLRYVVLPEVLDICCVTPGKTTQNAVMQISEGNHLHLFFDQAATTIWYTEQRLNTPTVPMIPLAGPATAVEATAVEATVTPPTGDAASAASTRLPAELRTPAPEPTTLRPPVLSLIAALFLIAIATIGYIKIK